MKSTVEDTVTFNENRENRIINLKRCYYFNIPTLFTAPNTSDLIDFSSLESMCVTIDLLIMKCVFGSNLYLTSINFCLNK